MFYLMSISECRWNLRAWFNLIREMQDPRICNINIAEISDWLTKNDSSSQTEETLLTKVDGAFRDVDCEVLCNAECHSDPESEQCTCQKNIHSLFDSVEWNQWSCFGDEATIKLSKLS